MVSPLVYFSRDPNRKKRGAGVYYLRGKGYYSKYHSSRDNNKLSRGWKVSKIGIPSDTPIPHTTDGRLPR